MGSCLECSRANQQVEPYDRPSTAIDRAEAPPSYEAAQRMQPARRLSHVHQPDGWSSTGLKRRAMMQRLPSLTYTDPRKPNRECVICMLDFTTGDRIKLLPCMHLYHSKCIQDWLQQSFTCPTCMDEVEQSLTQIAAAEANPAEFKWH